MAAVVRLLDCTCSNKLCTASRGMLEAARTLMVGTGSAEATSEAEISPRPMRA
jgi:hypothetical protein